MKIGIDVSQLAFQNTGVSNYLGSLVTRLVEGSEHEYVLFFSSLRGVVPQMLMDLSKKSNVRLVTVKFPPTVLHYIWNVLHVMPIEKFTGPIDLFLTSDWTEPPTRKAKKATIIYDLIVYKYPQESHNKTALQLKKLKISPNIVSIQKQKLSWVKKESDIIFCISQATKNDVHEILGIKNEKLAVIYPGF